MGQTAVSELDCSPDDPQPGRTHGLGPPHKGFIWERSEGPGSPAVWFKQAQLSNLDTDGVGTSLQDRQPTVPTAAATGSPWNLGVPVTTDRQGAVTGAHDRGDDALFSWKPTALLQGCVGPPDGERGRTGAPETLTAEAM